MLTSVVQNHTKLFVNYYYTLKQRATYKTIYVSINPQVKGYIQNCFDKCQYTPIARATLKNCEYLQLFIKYQNKLMRKATHTTVNEFENNDFGKNCK